MAFWSDLFKGSGSLCSQIDSAGLPAVQVVHAAVPGRTRLRVRGLKESPSLKLLLEAGLNTLNGCGAATFNIRIGTALVWHDPKLPAAAIASEIKGFLARSGRLGVGESAAVPAPPAVAVKRPIYAPSRSIKTKVIETLKFSPRQQPIFSWHSLEIMEVLARLESDPDRGLSHKEAKKRLKRFGPNTMPEPSPRSKLKILAGQFQSLPSALLGVAAGLSLATGGILDAAIITGVLAVNACIGYLTEVQSEKTIRSLRQIEQPPSRVIREGKPITVPAEQLVPGDLLVLQPGVAVGADCRIVHQRNLTVNESMLTGESLPAEKTAEPLSNSNVPLTGRRNMAFMGTVATGGQGLALVVATGAATEMGRLQVLLDDTVTPKTPIERQLNRIGNQLVFVCGAVCMVVFGTGFWRGFGLVYMLRISVSLAASAIPEGLPAIATTTLALGVRRMKEHQILVRNLEAIETLGAVQILCLDKTGTITRNKMEVREVISGLKRIEISQGEFLRGGKPMDPRNDPELKKLLGVAVLCNETKAKKSDTDGRPILEGSPTEMALLDLALDAGLDVKALRREHPLSCMNFRSESRLFMSTIHQFNGDERIQAVKGNPETVLDMCDWRLLGGRKIRLSPRDRSAIRKENKRMADQALRVLGLAFGPVNGGGDEEKHGLIWLGMVGMADPIREGVPLLIKTLHQAGIDTVMITGDQTPTAMAVAKAVGLSRNGPIKVVDAMELESADPEKWKDLARGVHVFSRVSPAQKLNIVQALQANGRVVAMTGDGVNDSPALKAAEVGIAMGQGGTNAAREVADLVLAEDRLEALIVAIQDGRTTQNNIKKAVHYLLSTNITEIMVVFSGLALGFGAPLGAMHLLWINLISDIFPGLALAMEKAESDVLRRPPRDPRQPLIDKKAYKRMVLEASVISAGTLASYGYALARHGAGPVARTIAFQSLSIGQILHALSCRSEKKRAKGQNQLPPNPYLRGAVLGSLAIQSLTMLIPGLRGFLGLTGVGLTDGLVIAAGSVLPLIANEFTKPAAKIVDRPTPPISLPEPTEAKKRGIKTASLSLAAKQHIENSGEAVYCS